MSHVDIHDGGVVEFVLMEISWPFGCRVEFYGIWWDSEKLCGVWCVKGVFFMVDYDYSCGVVFIHSYPMNYLYG